jgi:hypothetical protein
VCDYRYKCFISESRHVSEITQLMILRNAFLFSCYTPRNRLKWLNNKERICTIRIRLTINSGRAITQAVSRRLPTAAARVRAQVRSYGICGAQSGAGAFSLRVLRFPLPILIPPTAPHSSSSIIRGWYNRPNSGRRAKWAQSHTTPRN